MKNIHMNLITALALLTTFLSGGAKSFLNSAHAATNDSGESNEQSDDNGYNEEADGLFSAMVVYLPGGSKALLLKASQGNPEHTFEGENMGGSCN